MERRELTRTPDGEILVSTAVGPMVYAIYRDDYCMYVGASKNGLTRALHPQHHTASGMDPGDRIVFWKFDTEEEAFAAEREMILALYPLWNVQLNRA